MSTTVDERVVEMSFDNKNFESNAQESLSTLDKLKNALNFDGVGDFLTNMGDKIDSSGMDDLANATTNVGNKFGWLETIATGALLKIGSSIADTTMKLLDQVNPLKAIGEGWQGYADKTASVQTIMAATREQFSENEDQMAIVSEQLDRLNWFSDETSYSFLDMTNNIGKFTSQGVKLDDAVTSMMGISTWAALSGANANEASRAMYNLSQALGTGTVKLIDWKSIENANMATVEFKQTAIETAEAMGLLTKQEDGLWVTNNGLEVSVKNFNENLTKGAWFTNDVLTAALDKYGSFAVEMEKFTGLGAEGMDTIGDYFSTTSQLMKALDKYSTANATEQMEMLKDISEATGVSVEDLRTDFEYLNGEQFELGRRAFKAAQEAKTFQEAIDATKDAAKTAWLNIFESIFGNYEQAKVLWTNLANDLWTVMVGPIVAIGDVLADWNALGGRDLLFGIEDVDPGIFGNIAGGFTSIFDAVAEGFDAFGREGDEGFGKTLFNLTERLHDFSERFAEFAEAVAPKVEAVVGAISDKFRDLVDWVGRGITHILNFVKAFLEFFHVGDAVRGVFTLIGASFNAVVRILSSFGTTVRNISKMVKSSSGFTRFTESITKVKESLSGFLENNFFSKIGDGFNKLIGWLNGRGFGLTWDEQTGIAGIISNGFEIAANWIDNAANAVKSFAAAVQGSPAWQTLTNFVTKIKSVISSGFEWLTNGGLANNIKRLASSFVTFISHLKPSPNLLNLLAKAGNAVATVLKVLGGVILIVVDYVSKLIAKVQEYLQTHSFVETVINGAKAALEGIQGAINFVVEGVKSFIDTIKESEGFQKFVEFLTKIKDIVVGFFEEKIFDKISEWIDKIQGQGAEFEEKSKFVEFGEKISEILKTIVEWLEKAYNAVKDFGKQIAESDIAKQIGTIFSKIGEGDLQWSDVETLFELIGKKLREGLEKAIAWIDESDFSPAKLYDKAKELVSKFANGLKEGWEGTDLSSIWDGAKKGSMVFIAIIIGLAIARIVDGLMNLTKIPGSIVKLLKDFHSIFSSFSSGLKSTTLLNVALAIGILAGSIAGLALVFRDVDPTDINKAMLVVSMISLVVMGLLWALSSFMDAKAKVNSSTEGINLVALNLSKAFKTLSPFIGIAAVVASIAVGVFLLSNVMMELAKMKDEDYLVGALRMFSVISILALAFTILMGIQAVLGGPAMSIGAALSIVGFAAGVALLADPLKKLAEIPDGNKLLNAAMVISGVLISLAGSAAIASSFGAGAGTFIGMGVAMVGIGLGLLMMKTPLIEISKIGPDSVNGAMTIGLIILALGGAAAIGNTGALLALALDMVAVGIAALMMWGPISTFADLGLDALTGAAVISLILLALAGASAISNTFSLLALALDMIAVAIATNMMEEPLTTIAGLGEGALIGAALLAMILLALGGAAAIGGGASFLGLAAALIALGIGITLFNEAVNSTDQVNANGLIQVLLEMAMLIVGLTVGLFAVGAAANFAGVGFLMVGGGLLMAGAGIALVVGSIALLITAIANTGVAVGSFGELVGSVFSGIGEAFSWLTDAISTAASWIGDHIVGPVKEAFGWLKGEGSTAGTETGTNLVTSTSTAMQGFPAALNTGVPEAIGQFEQSMGSISTAADAPMNNLLTSMTSFGPQFQNVMGENGQFSLAGLQEMFPQMDTSMLGEMTNLQALMGGEGANFQAIMGENGAASLAGLESTFPGMDMSMLTQLTGLENMVGGEAPNFEAMNQLFSQAGLTGMESQYPNYDTSLITQWTSMENTVLNQQTPMTQVTSTVMDTAKINGVDSKLNAYNSSAQTLFGESGVSGGIRAKQGAVTSASGDVAQAGANAVRNKRGEAESSGGHFAGGFAQGIRNAISSVVSAASELASSALSSIKGFLGISSPAKEGIYVGEMLDRGFAIGLERFSNLSESAAEQTARNALTQVQDALARADAMLSESVNPTITPVLDLSNVQNGASELNDMFSGTGKLGVYGTGINSAIASGRSAMISGDSTSSSTANTFNITVNGGPGSNPKAIADEVMNRIVNDFQRRKAAFG